MGSGDTEVVGALLERFIDGDSDGALAYYAAEVEFDARHFPDGQIYHGHDGVRAFMRSLRAAITDYELAVEGIFKTDDEVVVLATERGRGRASGAIFEVACAQRYTVRDGRVVRWRVRSRSGASRAP